MKTLTIFGGLCNLTCFGSIRPHISSKAVEITEEIMSKVPCFKRPTTKFSAIIYMVEYNWRAFKQECYDYIYENHTSIVRGVD